MRIFGWDIQETFLGLFQDPEERKYFEEKEQKRKERIHQQCENWEMNEDHRFWDITELPRGVFVSDVPTDEDVKIHSMLQMKNECHIFYGKKFCYHTDNGEIVTDIKQ